MKTIKEEFSELAANLKFQLSETELDKIVQEYLVISNKIALIKNTDTKDILPMNFILNLTSSDCLREDIPMDDDPAQVFSNCKNFKHDMVVIKNETK